MMRFGAICLWLLLSCAGVALAQDGAHGSGARPAASRSAQKQHDAAAQSSRQGWTLIKSPLLAEAMLFNLPHGFGPVFRSTKDRVVTHEFVPKGESADKFTRMISVIAYKDLALSPLASPSQFAEGVGNLFRRNCPDSYSGASLGARKFQEHDAYAAIMSCGLVKPEDPYSETTLFVVIRGEKDFFTLQWTERGMPSATPIRFDQSKWVSRLDSFAPVRLCSNKPGEFPLFPGCYKPE